MLLSRLDFRGFTGNRSELREALPRPVDEQERSAEAVAAIIAEVRAHGDSALRDFTQKFDGVVLDELRVPTSEVKAALDRIPAALQAVSYTHLTLPTNREV